MLEIKVIPPASKITIQAQGEVPRAVIVAKLEDLEAWSIVGR